MATRTRKTAAPSARVLGAATALAATLACAQTSIPPQYPIRDFFSNPDQGYFRLSADGKTLGFMQPVVEGDNRRLNVFVQPLQGSKPVGSPRKLTSETARDISSYYWKGARGSCTSRISAATRTSTSSPWTWAAGGSRT